VQQSTGSRSLPEAAQAAEEAVTTSLSGWHPLQQDGAKQAGLSLPPRLPPPAEAVSTDAQGRCVVDATALAAAVAPLQQLQVLTIQEFPAVSPVRLAAYLLHYMTEPRLRRLRHRGCTVVDDASKLRRYAPIQELLEAIAP
jgi:hypothetical protein